MRNTLRAPNAVLCSAPAAACKGSEHDMLRALSSLLCSACFCACCCCCCLWRRYGPCEPDALKMRMMRAVAALGRGEIEDIMRQEGKVRA